MNFSPSVSCSQEKEDKDMSSVWHFWKGLLLPINQATSVLIDRLSEINRIEKRETFYLAAVWVDSGPTISITVANLGPNRNLLNYCAVPKLRLFPFIISVISWCESWMCEWRKWEKIANIFEGRILLLIVNWPFPPSHLLDAKLSKIEKPLTIFCVKFARMETEPQIDIFWRFLLPWIRNILFRVKVEYNLSRDHCRNLQSKWFSDHRMRWWYEYEYGGGIGLTIIW